MLHGAGLFTLWLFNIDMENDPFIDDFPMKTSIYRGFSMAMLNNQMVATFSPNQCPSFVGFSIPAPWSIWDSW